VVWVLWGCGFLVVVVSPIPLEPLTRYENALVRIRGCVVPVRNQVSQQVQVGQIRLSNVALSVDETAPLDPFAAVLKHPSELLLFDARAGSLQRVKVAGQILHVRGNELFLIDHTNTVRVLLRDAVEIEAGDLVEVVGFPELGGTSPILREAVLRSNGKAPLPAALVLANDSLFTTSGLDGKLVSVQARLIGVSGSRWQRIVELQNGNREFIARVADSNNVLANLIAGSWLELTGVYAEQGAGSTAGRAMTSFELLLNSPADLKVLARPSWWTLQRVLMFAGGLVIVILAGIFWIVLLHRRVEENAAKLALEVRRREKVQQQNVLEKERTRIAKDMHDQLGTNVTQVGLLAELTRKNAGDLEKTERHAELICQRAIELGRTLDEIVWAVNPKNDSLDKFCDYVAVQAQELFQLTDILCRVDLPPEMPNYPLSAEVRHSLFLATKEALNNVVRHAGAREVWIRFKLETDAFEISIVDDGRGFVFEPKHSLRNGMQNMRKRMEEIGGDFRVASEPGRGTDVTFAMALNVKRAIPAGVERDARESESGL
jgi:signal transduction histidine kinase